MHSSFNSCSFSAAAAGRRFAGSHLWTTRPNFEHFFFSPSLLLRFFLSPSVPRGAQRWSEASQEIRPHSIVHLRLALASTQHFGVFSVPASVMQPISRSPCLSTLKTCQLWNEAFSSSLVFPLWSAWMLVARRSLVCSADQATSLTTQSAPRAHRPTVENTFVIFYVCKAKPKIKETSVPFVSFSWRDTKYEKVKVLIETRQSASDVTKSHFEWSKLHLKLYLNSSLYNNLRKHFNIQ